MQHAETMNATTEPNVNRRRLTRNDLNLESGTISFTNQINQHAETEMTIAATSMIVSGPDACKVMTPKRLKVLFQPERLNLSVIVSATEAGILPERPQLLSTTPPERLNLSMIVSGTEAGNLPGTHHLDC